MLLGDFVIQRSSFKDLDGVFREFETKEFQKLIDRKRSEWVNRVLLELIQKEKEPCFLLAAVLEFIEKVEKEKLLTHYTFTSFELWLNQFSQLSFEENLGIRAKIAGKAIPRSEYELLFPIGMGKVYEGTHFVTAHRSPDLDTTIASFWGWLDAFAARVGSGLHIWNLPGGPPGSQIEIDLIFRDLFGPAVFTHLPKTRNALALTGNDLMTQKHFLRKMPHEGLASIDHSREEAVVIIDDQGFYLGDWRSVDVEGVRRVMILLAACLRWFENHLHLRLISLFAEETLDKSEMSPAFHRLFDLKIRECEPAQEFTPAQGREVHAFLVEVLGVSRGLESSFAELNHGLAKWGMGHLIAIEDLLAAMEKAELFDRSGKLIENRPRIFLFLRDVVSHLHEAILKIRSRMEQFDIALAIKDKVFHHLPSFVSVRSDVEEIRNKMSSHQFLTVAYPDQGRFYPVGVILATDLMKNILGTVSLRDFCNREEMTIPPYLEVISVIDHHKTSLQTFSPPLAIIGDVQSSNTLVARAACQINDRERMLQKRMGKEGSFIDPNREFIEYLHFLYAILDDTDLLTKVTALDVEMVASLLNRLKSLKLHQETEVVHFDDLPRDKEFPKLAAKRLLQNEEMYSLYRRVYQYRETEVEHNIHACVEHKPSHFFADTKEQNGCCRIGQTKIFANNVRLFEKKAAELRRVWLEKAVEVHREHKEIDFHMHMISTIVSAEEVFKGKHGAYEHQDECWIWFSPDEMGTEHLKNFLNAFSVSPGMKHNRAEVEFLGPNAKEFTQIFQESYAEVPRKTAKKIDSALPMAVLRYNAGSLNSRKALISPFLPTTK
jgi:hypothetical protein